jgi:hypothetical protein
MIGGPEARTPDGRSMARLLERLSEALGIDGVHDGHRLEALLACVVYQWLLFRGYEPSHLPPEKLAEITDELMDRQRKHLLSATREMRDDGLLVRRRLEEAKERQISEVQTWWLGIMQRVSPRR